MSILDLFSQFLHRPTGTAAPARPAERQQPRLIVGGSRAPELCQHPRDGDWNLWNQVAQNGQALVELKVDGIRALYLDGRIVSREGLPLDCALHCQPGLAQLEKQFGEPMMFDAEYQHEEGFNATVAEHRRGAGTGIMWVFDAVPLSQWREDRCEVPLATRKALLLAAYIGVQDQTFIGLLQHKLLDVAEAARACTNVWAQGGEGIMIKRADSLYTRRRSGDWMRMKQRLLMTLPIVDMVSQGGALQKMLVRGPDAGPPFWVATGWSAAEGEKLVRHYEQGVAVPIDVEIEFELTTGRMRSVRGAKFIRIRSKF